MMDARKGAAVALAIGAAAIGFGLVIAFPGRSSSEKADMVKHPVIADARKKPMMTMVPRPNSSLSKSVLTSGSLRKLR